LTPKLYKALEVCEATGLQPYVLRSWEKEFPGIGIQRSPDSPRLYRQSDLEQVQRIKELVFAEGLTLAGARRRLEESTPRTPEDDDAELAEVLETIGVDVRARIAVVRDGLRSILDVLSRAPGSTTLRDLPRLRVLDGTEQASARQAPNGRTRKSPSKHAAVAREKNAGARKRPAGAKARVTKGKRGRLRTQN
jgi:DNA-binding transcriptional MerR regulator